MSTYFRLQKLSNIVLFERCFLDIEQFQTHHFQQFLVTSNGVASTTFALLTSSTGDLHRARKKVPRVSDIGDNFASKSSVFDKWFFSEVLNSRSCDKFSLRAPPD